MVIEEKCKACGNVLFRKVSLDDRGDNWAVLDEDSKKYESIWKRDGKNEYYECSQCKKKNWIESFSEPGKGRKTWISHASE